MAQKTGNDASVASSHPSSSTARSRSRKSNTTTTTTAASNANQLTSTARAASQPKARTKNASAANSKSSSGKSNKTNASAKQTVHEAAIAAMKKRTSALNTDEREAMLQQLLQAQAFEDAAYLIASCPHLSGKFKVSDVIRLLIDAPSKLDQAGRLIRAFQLQSNQLLVTLFIKELVRAAQFHTAMRAAQELVQNFGKKQFSPRDQARPSWTPQALVQAMIRAQHYRTAFTYANQYELFELFPATQLVGGMLANDEWNDAVSSVLEAKLFAEFPLEVLISKLLEVRQWSAAMKCINKLGDPPKYLDMVVREAARAGDFIAALKFMREFKLDQPASNGDLLRHYVDCLITYKRYYKAIKYAIKFQLAPDAPKPATAEQEPKQSTGDGENAKYAVDRLIRLAIRDGQCHVATTYIKRLKLQSKFEKELTQIQEFYARMLQDFRDFVAFRDEQRAQSSYQAELCALVGDRAEPEVEVESKSVDVVISEEEEVIPRKPKASAPAAPIVQDDDDDEEVILLNQPANRSRIESRFDFARRDSSSSSTSEPKLPTPAKDESKSAFEFTQLASSFPDASKASTATKASSPKKSATAVAAPAPSSVPAPLPPAPQPQAAKSHPPPPPPPLPRDQPRQQPQPTQHGNYPATSQFPPPPPPPLPPQQGFNNFFYHGSDASRPPPPPPGNGPSGSFGAQDISALVMQFHANPPSQSRPSPHKYQGDSSTPFAFHGHPPPPPPPPQPQHPHTLSHLFPSHGPPPPPPLPPSGPPRSSFKPSVFTSVTTTRQKR